MSRRLFFMALSAQVLMLLFPGRGNLMAQEFAISSNVADYVDYGTLNMGFSYALAQHWSLDAVVQYNPFSYDYEPAAGGEMRNKQRSIAFGAKWWPWHIYSGWWLCTRARLQEFNRSPYSDACSEEGTRWGGSFSGGYSYMLSEHLNLDFGAGLWLGGSEYTKYACPRCGRIISKGREMFLLPADITLGVSYVF